MQKYSTYKPSNVEWLGDIPSHWKVDRLRDIASINSETLGSDTPKDYQLRYIDISNVNYSGVISFDAIETLEFENAPSRAKRITKAKDTIISSVRPNLQAVCYIDFDDTNLICSTGFNVVRTRNEILDSRFLFYCLISDISKDFFVSRANGVGYPAIGDYDFGSLKISFPTKSEQIVIAAYLDHATANIDHVIATKQKQLEKLEQYKQSKIHECVTKGLNPDVTLKPSGINWIGDVPSHWRKIKLRYEIEIRSGEFVSNTELEAGGDFPVFGGNGIMGYVSKFNIESERLIIGRVGAKCGNVHHVENPAWISDNALILASHHNYRYLFFLLIEMNLNSISSQSAQPLITGTKIKNEYVVLPPIGEQIEIAEYLNDFTQKISKEKSIIDQQIEKLKQYRKCLIHECVTGKRKVTE